MLLSLSVALSLLPAALANFRIGCTALSHERLDPLVSPGKVSAHVHDFFGASSFGPKEPSFNDLRKSKCTSCQVQQDKSVYWTPSLYFQWKNGSFTAVEQQTVSALYYWTPEQQKNALPFPEGFRMISGNPLLRSDQKLPSQTYGAVVFACQGSYHENTPYLPYKKCDAGLRADIYFPNCWDGKNVDSPNHASHVAYSANLDEMGTGTGEGSYGASLPGSGACPKSHPKRLVSLSLSRFFDTSGFDYSKAKNPKQPFVFSNGDPTGYGFHGDIINGWDVPVLKSAIQQCTYKDASPEFCPPFKMQSTTQDSEPYAPLCRRTPSVNEPTRGPLRKLPGCNPVTKGPANAKPVTNCPAVPTFAKPVVYSGPVPPVNSKVPVDIASVLPAHRSYKYNGCYSSSSRSLALGTKVAISGKITPQKCLTACEKKKFAFCGLQGNNCFGAKSINKSSKAQQIGVCYTPCAGSLNYCGGPAAVSIYRRS